MIHNYFEGFYWILSFVSPLGAVTVLWIFLLMIPVGRKILEGKFYDVSLTSSIGDKGLTVIALCGAEIMHRGAPVYVPVWLEDGHVQIAILALAFVVCILVSVTTYKDREARFMDLFHDLLIAPIFVTMVIVVVPVIWMNGTGVEKTVTIGSLLLWSLLIFIDHKTGRFYQQKYRRFQEEKRRNRTHFIFSA